MSQIPTAITEQINAKANSTLLNGSPKYYTYISGAEFGYSLAAKEITALKLAKVQLQSGVNLLSERIENQQKEIEELKAEIERLKKN